MSKAADIRAGLNSSTNRDAAFGAMVGICEALHSSKAIFSPVRLKPKGLSDDLYAKLLDIAMEYRVIYVNKDNIPVFDDDLTVGENLVKSNYNSGVIHNKLFRNRVLLTDDRNVIDTALKIVPDAYGSSLGLRDFMVTGRAQREASQIIVRSLMRGDLSQTFDKKFRVKNRYAVNKNRTKQPRVLPITEVAKNVVVKHDDGMESVFNGEAPKMRHPRTFKRKVYVYRTEEMEWFKDIVTDLMRVKSTKEARDVINDAHRFEHAMLLAQFPTSTVQTLHPNAEKELYAKRTRFAEVVVKWHLGNAFLVMVPGATYLALVKERPSFSTFLFQELEYTQTILD